MCLCREHALEIDEEALHLQLGKAIVKQFPGALQFLSVMLSLCRAIILVSGEPAIGRTIRVANQICALRLMEQDGHAHLLEDEVALKIIARRSQRFGSAGDDDHVRPQDAPPL